MDLSEPGGRLKLFPFRGAGRRRDEQRSGAFSPNLSVDFDLRTRNLPRGLILGRICAGSSDVPRGVAVGESGRGSRRYRLRTLGATGVPLRLSTVDQDSETSRFRTGSRTTTGPL